MKVKMFLTAVALCAISAKAQNPQIANSDFESWTNYSSSNYAPDNWNSFQTAEGSLASMVSAKQVDKSENVRPGSAGKSSAVIWCRTVFSVPAQGNLTLGCINAGAMTAAAAGNYNFSKTSDASKSEALQFVQKNGEYVTPDSLVAWVRFVPKNASHKARISAIIHDAYDYITPSDDQYDTDENKSHVYSQGTINFGKGDWTRISMPFKKSGNNIKPEYIIVNVSTNATPGQGTKDDSLYVDDIELIYNPAMYAVNVTSSSYRMGTVTVNGVTNGKAAEGSQITIKAEPKQGYKFLQWSDGNTEAERTITVDAAIMLVAQFATEGGEPGPIGPEEDPDTPIVNPYTPCLFPDDELEEANVSDPIELPEDYYEDEVVKVTYVETDYIANPSFEEGNVSWSISSSALITKPTLNVGGEENNANGEIKAAANSGLFAPNTDYNFSQTISVPNGVYRASVQAFYQDGALDACAAAHEAGNEVIHTQFYVNDQKVNVRSIFDAAQAEPLSEYDGEFSTALGYVPTDQETAARYFANGLYEVTIENIVVTDGQIKIGLVKDNTKSTASRTCFDNFTLTYLGDGNEVFTATLPKENSYKAGSEITIPFSVPATYNDAEKNEVTVALINTDGEEVTSSTVKTDPANQDVTIAVPNDLAFDIYYITCTLNNPEVEIKKPVVIYQESAPAVLSDVAWTVEDSYSFAIAEETAEVKVDFNYKDAIPELGWKYIYMYLVNESDEKTLLGYADAQNETSISGNLPNEIANGTYHLMLQAGKDGVYAESKTFTIDCHTPICIITLSYEGTDRYIEVVRGETIEYPEMPEKEGYTFHWINAPTVASKNITLEGEYVINQYYIAFVDEDGTEITGNLLDYGSEIVIPEVGDKEGFKFVGWTPEVAKTVPASDVTYTAVWEVIDAIDSISSSASAVEYYTPNGVRISSPQKGLNIIKMSNGKTIKVLCK